MKKIILLSLIAAVLVTGASAAFAKGIKISGSTTVLPLSQIWAEEYMAKHSDVSISVSGGGSGVGISSVINGSIDIGNASRAAVPKMRQDKVRKTQLFATKIAKDGMAIIVHSSNNVKNVTMAQLAAIYSGKTTRWKQVGGRSSKDIVLVGRDSSSGTYGFFQEVVLGGRPYKKGVLALASNEAIAQAVAQSKDAIGYVGLAYAEQFAKKGKIRILTISRKTGEPGIMPSEKAVSAETYPLFRFLFAYTLGKPKGTTGSFLRFCTGPEGQALVKSVGYLPLK